MEQKGHRVEGKKKTQQQGSPMRDKKGGLRYFSCATVLFFSFFLKNVFFGVIVTHSTLWISSLRVWRERERERERESKERVMGV